MNDIVPFRERGSQRDREGGHGSIYHVDTNAHEHAMQHCKLIFMTRAHTLNIAEMAFNMHKNPLQSTLHVYTHVMIYRVITVRVMTFCLLPECVCVLEQIKHSYSYSLCVISTYKLLMLILSEMCAAASTETSANNHME